jgi:hypothetical protein
MNLPWFLNTAWMSASALEARRFRQATRAVGETQRRLLLDTMSRNRSTEFGVRHGFADIRSTRMYQERVPLSTYADFATRIERIAAREANVLTTAPVRLLEPTSGTVSGEKLIPYTAELQRQFQRGVAAWISDLMRHRPAIRNGRAYWSISPTLGPPRRSTGAIPIGFASDAEYLGGIGRWLLGRLLIVPGDVAQLGDISDFRYATLRHLLAADDLALISIWNPTFLLALFEPLPAWQDRLCDDIERGTLTLPTKRFAVDLRPEPHRADAVRRILRSRGVLSELWPRLAAISCWTDAAAGRFVPALREMFPDVEIQPKGLLATEAFVSFPLVGAPGAALAIRSHFFEFEECDSGRIVLAHEVQAGVTYRVIVTTAGGLYRYQLRDEIVVVGFRDECPLIRFVGKSDLVSDLVGEKLAEPHVRSALDRCETLGRLAPRFVLLVPVLASPPRYRLYLQGPTEKMAVGVLSTLREELATRLGENPHYRHAVAIGQLAPAEIALLDPAAEAGWLIVERRALELGRKSGDVKPAVLDRWTGWPDRFPVPIATG